jgi:membrane protein DedA with SNARE-associated domain
MSTITAWFQELSRMLPLETFVVIGGFFEELIGPIPSPLVMTLAGSIAAERASAFWYLLILAALGSAGKTAAAWLLYLLGDKAEHWIIGKWGPALGLSHEKVYSWKKSFDGSWYDTALIVFLRAVPILPASPISVLCGVLKIDLRTYLVSTLIGYTLRSLFFLWIGYVGTDAYKAFAENVTASEAILTAASALGVLVLAIWLYYAQRKKRWWRHLLERIAELLKKCRNAFLRGGKRWDE